ncbi:MAG: cell division protein FtsQ/DivIB [Holosporales bacterium]|jgi:cell division septal protein FtsQ|nr:cell division protein FtsQ/DivIB [Holosporales bacterium]
MAKKSKFKKKQTKNKKFIAVVVSGMMLSGGGYLTFGYITSYFWSAVDCSLKFAGFTVKTIDIQQIQRTQQLPDRSVLNVFDHSNIINLLGIKEGDSIFKLSAREIHNNIMKDSTILDAIVRKKLPNVISVKISKKIPIAIFQRNSKLILIDDKGSIIADVTDQPPKLPLVVGDEANVNAKSVLDLISQYESTHKGLETLVFVRKRRWNIEVSGIKVKLPESGVEKALETLTILMRQNNINRKTVKYIDLRIPGSVIINGLTQSKKSMKRAIV